MLYTVGMSLLKLFFNPTTLIAVAVLGAVGYLRHDAKMDERARSQIVCDGRIQIINDQIEARNAEIRAAQAERQRKIDALLESRAAELAERDIEATKAQETIDEYEAKLKDATTCLVTDDDVDSLQ